MKYCKKGLHELILTCLVPYYFWAHSHHYATCHIMMAMEKASSKMKSRQMIEQSTSAFGIMRIGLSKQLKNLVLLSKHKLWEVLEYEWI